MKWLLRRLLTLTIYSLIITLTATGQSHSYRIFFTDKGPAPFRPGSPLYEQTRQLYTERALQRRQKVRPADQLFDYHDAPLYPPYLRAIAELSDSLIMFSRWFNYVVAITDSSRLAQILQFPFVKAVQPTSSKFRPLHHSDSCSAVFLTPSDYGDAFHQLLLMNIPFLHSLGIDGTNVLIGITDTGFRTDHIAFQRLRKLAEYDFIQRDTITSWQAGELKIQPEHGTAVLSILAGFYPDSLIGVAYNATYALAKTEDLRWERHIEEDHYLEALEWFDRLGVDIVSTSLGYFDFDPSDSSYRTEELDGRTTLVAQAVNRAVSTGMIVVAAAGNSGNFPNSILSPADADSVIAVAALRSDGRPAAFSSRGPRIDSVLRPTIAAQGVRVRCVDARTTDRFGYSTGTSMATPLISGGIALLLSAFPELTPAQVRSLLYSTAAKAQNPDFKQGYGLANFLAAAEAYDILLSPHLFLIPLDSMRYRIGTFAYSPIGKLQLFAQWSFADSSLSQTSTLQRLHNSHFFFFDLFLTPRQAFNHDSIIIVQLTASDGIRQRVSRLYQLNLHVPCYPPKLDRWLTIPQSRTTITLHSVAPKTVILQPASPVPLLTIALYSLEGRLLTYHQLFPNATGSFLLSLPPLSPGCYLLTVETVNDQTSKLLIIPNHHDPIVIIDPQTDKF